MVAYNDEQITLGDPQPQTIDDSKELFTVGEVRQLLAVKYGLNRVSERTIRKAAQQKGLQALPR